MGVAESSDAFRVTVSLDNSSADGVKGRDTKAMRLDTWVHGQAKGVQLDGKNAGT